MTDYTKNNSFSSKTGLPIVGADFDSEFNEIQTAIASKEDKANKNQPNGYAGLDSTGKLSGIVVGSATESAAGAIEIATAAEALAGTDNTRAITPAGFRSALGYGAGMLADIGALAAPIADTLLFWDYSAGAVAALTPGSGIQISGTTISAVVDGGDLGNLNASNLTTGSVPDARVPATNVTQHQASLTITETQITDGSVLARVGGNETITGNWTFSGTMTKSGEGRIPYLVGSTNTGGAITISTAAASGTPANGDLWLQYTA